MELQRQVRCRPPLAHFRASSQLGADINKDVACQWLTFFMDDDKRLDQIKSVSDAPLLRCGCACDRAQDYASGKMLTSEVKKELADVLSVMLTRFQRARVSLLAASCWLARTTPHCCWPGCRD